MSTAVRWSVLLCVVLLGVVGLQQVEARVRQAHRPDHIPAWLLARFNASESDVGRDRTLSSIISWITSLWSGAGGTGGTGGTGGVSGGSVEITSSETTAVSLEGSSEDTTITPCDSGCKCGVASSRSKIVGGQETRVNAYPWMAMLLYDDRFYCGATLITEKHVLTAAHCVSGFTARRIKVRLLEHNTVTSTETRVVTRSVVRATPHPRYSQNTFNNDIALLRLDQPVPLGGGDLSPACLPERGKRFTGLDGIVTGWGKVAENRPTSTVLREVSVPILSNTKCGNYYGSSQITDNMMCAGIKEGGKDSCQGDSGGPLHIRNGTSHHIVGVVSWGEGCARPNNPGVYARVNRYLSWIAANTERSCFCPPAL